jgi:hypothetical protein
VSLPKTLGEVSPIVLAGLLLAVSPLFLHFGWPRPTVEQILAATGATKSRAYEIALALVALLPALLRPAGRPPSAPVEATDEDRPLTRAVLDFVMLHPGCADRGPARQRYSDAFRIFVVERRVEHATMDIATFSAAACVPLGTLKDWLRDPTSAPPAPAVEVPVETDQATLESAHIQTVLDAWGRWSGGFLPFCDHVRDELHVPFGRDLVRRVLEVYGARKTARRPGRSPDEFAIRGSFKTYFPGAQWVADGLQVPVFLGGKRFVYNVELHVDPHTGAFVGLSVRDTEDALAVIESFKDGVATTGAAPIADLLDNRPSNHTPEVVAALGDTVLIRATTERAQNKAHCEGAFGLFSQILPPLVLDTTQPARDIGRAFVGLVANVWARASNHRPRKDRDGHSRVDLYAEVPTSEQIAQARRELRELADRQEKARRTAEARRKPEVLALLDVHFTRLGLLDPSRHVRIVIAGYPVDAILAGIAIYDAKILAGTLPEGVDARYLLGIVRNHAERKEGEIIARKLFELRIEVHDTMLASLVAAAAILTRDRDPADVVPDCVARVISAVGALDRSFWLDTAAAMLRLIPILDRRPAFLVAARRFEATFSLRPRERHDLVCALAERAVLLH